MLQESARHLSILTRCPHVFMTLTIKMQANLMFKGSNSTLTLSQIERSASQFPATAQANQDIGMHINAFVSLFVYFYAIFQIIYLPSPKDDSQVHLVHSSINSSKKQNAQEITSCNLYFNTRFLVFVLQAAALF